MLLQLGHLCHKLSGTSDLTALSLIFGRIMVVSQLMKSSFRLNGLFQAGHERRGFGQGLLNRIPRRKGLVIAVDQG
jgi:hypothetical protein